MTRTDHFKVGFFILAGIALGIGTLIWIGTFHPFQQTRTYVTFFNHSVDGLSSGSDVKYLGLHVGKVKSIGMTPDQQLIRVLLELKPDFRVNSSMAVEIASGGITGPKYLAISKAPPDIKEQTPPINFPTKYPVIPSQGGQGLAQIESNVEKLTRKVDGLDLQGLVNEWKQAGHDAQTVLSDAQIREAIANIAKASMDLRRVMDALGRHGSPEELQKSVSDLAATASAARKSSEAVEAQLRALPPKSIEKLDKRVNRVIELSESLIRLLNRQGGRSMAIAQQDLSDVHQLVSELKQLAEELKEQPSRILTHPKEGIEPFKR